MATLLLQVAGGFLGGMLGPLGATIGTAAGAMIGYTLDRALIDGARHHEGPRLSGPRPFTGEEGASLPRVYGTMRVGGTMIWATRFEEEARTERQGGKGGGARATTYHYFANVAFALCEGEIAGVRRIWADGRELDLSQVEYRVYRGSQHQPPDPLILARQGSGNAPAYRGTAYAVLERFPLDEYGNRVPQFHFEVMRPVGELHRRIKAVAMIPGSTEYGLSDAPVSLTLLPGEAVSRNRHVLQAGTDFEASLDELQALCPALENIGLVVTWFGDDLRAGHCRIRPMVMRNSDLSYSEPWVVSGLERTQAAEVSEAGPGPAYGGTPSDASVVAAIREIRRRGLKVTLYPFVMMDVPAANVLPDPYGAEGQPPYPWRGRITCDPAPGRPGTADKTAAARAQVQAFSGNASAGHFRPTDGTVLFQGFVEEWSYRRLVLHYAMLAQAAGGVDAFLLGSEMRGLTALRDGSNAFPFVEQLCDLAAEVRAVLGPGTLISYGADWSEYFGHQPADGSGDVFFHLDPLWAHPAVDAVGIDCYVPLSDWREADAAGGNPDGFASPYDIRALRSGIGSGEGYDWYYADLDARIERRRTPISDGAYGKPWVFRYKDIEGWWSNPHHDRPGGVELPAPTGWIPRSKPIWLTELGCPAVDKGPNQPNVFPDPKSSENALPYFSDAGRSDTAQHNLLVAHLDRWDGQAADFDGAQNPVSPVYGGRMLDASHIYMWCWDARPFPAFPLLKDVWSDGLNWMLGHWLTGRISGVEVGDLINAILQDHGLPRAKAGSVAGSLAGYIVADPASARAALEPLVELYGLAVRGEGDRLEFSAGAAALGATVEIDELVVPQSGPVLARTRLADHDLPAEAVISFHDPFREYQSATARSARPGVHHAGQEFLGIPAAMESGQSETLLADWTRRRWEARERIEFAVPATRVDVVPGSAIRLPGHAGAAEFMVTSVEAGAARSLSATQIRRGGAAPWHPSLPQIAPGIMPAAGPPLVLAMDLPMPPGGGAFQDQFRLAVRARPWRPHAVLVSPEAGGYEIRTSVSREATIGILQRPVGPGFEGRRDLFAAIDVSLYRGELSSVSLLRLLNGANLAALEAANGEWEVFQFQHAEEIAPSLWRLSGLLRGQGGTRPAMLAGAQAGSHFVLLDEAVVPAGLRPAEAGLQLNWMVGPAGADIGGAAYRTLPAIGGQRALRPVSPVHMRMKREADGSLRVTWVRRSRVDGDQGLWGSPPLGEEREAYLLSVAPAGQPALRAVEVSAPEWTYPAAQLAEDFALLPAEIEITVRQISTTAGPGDPLSRRVSINRRSDTNMETAI